MQSYKPKCLYRNYPKELALKLLEVSSMNKEHIGGKAEEIKGKAKVKVGHATDDPDTEVAGLKGQAKGKVKQTEGDVKEASHKTS
jgi:uncharacterized protein YjbJ (UPF0337 family)